MESVKTRVNNRMLFNVEKICLVLGVMLLFKSYISCNFFVFTGRSMGARVAAELATTSNLTNQFIFGVACLSYPLHPPRRTHELRMSSIIHLGVPVLFVSGTRDSFCRRDLMEKVLEKIGVDWTMHWVERADHSLNITNKPNNEVIDMMCEWMVKWCQSVFMAER